MEGSENQTSEFVDILIRVTRKFHITMDAGEIVREVFTALKDAFPYSVVKLHLSQDWEVKEYFPEAVVTYGYENINNMIKQAYVTGQLQIDESTKDGASLMYFPLRGKQGVYGVLQLLQKTSSSCSVSEKEFINALADLGGNALENSELYQQSQELVEDLQLLNETSHILNSNLKVTGIIKSMNIQITKFIPKAKIVFILLDGHWKIRELGDPFLKCKNNLVAAEHILEEFKLKNEPLFVSDFRLFKRYQFSKYLSMMAVPMVQGEKLIGAVIILAKDVNAFSFRQYKLFQSLVEHSTLAFANADLHEKLEQMAITDHLTKLYNRNFLDGKIHEYLDKGERGTLLLFDIDDFKRINDTYGHQAGDDIIIQVSHIIKNNVREKDIAARWGGEEIAIYLPEARSEIGRTVAHRIINHVALHTSPAVTMSCGVASWEKGKKVSPDSLFKAADQAMYTAKNRGKNQVIVKGSVHDTSQFQEGL